MFVFRGQRSSRGAILQFGALKMLLCLSFFALLAEEPVRIRNVPETKGDDHREATKPAGCENRTRNGHRAMRKAVARVLSVLLRTAVYGLENHTCFYQALGPWWHFTLVRGKFCSGWPRCVARRLRSTFLVSSSGRPSNWKKGTLKLRSMVVYERHIS